MHIKKFGRYVGVLVLIVLSTAVGVPAQTGYPVLLVDNSEQQELCNDPSLIAYPCFRTIQAAIASAGDTGTSVILVMPTSQPYAGFHLGGGIRALLIQGFRGVPTIQGSISIEGEFQAILQDLDIQGTINVGTSGLGPLFTRLQRLTIETSGTGVRVGKAGIVEILDSVICGGSCDKPGGPSEAGGVCGIELAFDGQGIIVVQGKEGLTAIWGFLDGICTKEAEKSRALFLINVQLAFNARYGMKVTGDLLQPTGPGLFLSMRNSSVQFNGEDGLRLQGVRGYVWGNQIRFNASDGIVLDSGEVDISYNDILFNRGCGVLNLGPKSVTGRDNNISGNGRGDLCPPNDFPPDFKK